MSADEPREEPNPAKRKIWNRPPDPQAIEEDPDVEQDPLIRKIRALLESGEPMSRLLKGRED
ncbi:hypothetical protein AUJ46_06180 [Candidatus Peregrinibacteria bacterium CG1_02_54_53]|nr:MAG: hypothetical protein AUJ46_06180 [Candidatus Peregrinibacteria bacterium CG1_02_54_53]